VDINMLNFEFSGKLTNRKMNLPFLNSYKKIAQTTLKSKKKQVSLRAFTNLKTASIRQKNLKDSISNSSLENLNSQKVAFSPWTTPI